MSTVMAAKLSGLCQAPQWPMRAHQETLRHRVLELSFQTTIFNALFYVRNRLHARLQKLSIV